MKPETIDNTNTSVSVITRHFDRCGAVLGDVASIESDFTHILQQVIKPKPIKAKNSPFEAEFIFETQTGIAFFNVKPSISKKHHVEPIMIWGVNCVDMSNFNNDLFFLNIEEDNNMKSISNDLLAKIDSLDKAGKKHESIKETHKLFQNLLSKSSVDVADQVLKLSTKKNFSLAVLIALLATTLPFKDALPNRELVFNQAEQVAINQLGPEKVANSIFNTLK